MSAPPPSGEWVRRVLDSARRHLDMDVAWLSVFADRAQEIRAATGALDAMHVREGMQAPLEGSFCVRVLSGQLPPVVTGARRDDRTRDLEVTGQLGIGSYVGAPVRSPDGQPIGMLCCLSRSDGTHLDASSARTLELLAELLAEQLRDELAPWAPDRTARAARVRQVLDEGAVTTHVQPIVDLATGEPTAYEALARFPDCGEGPATLFSDAAAAGLGVELEELSARAALALAPRLPTGRTLGVNLSPQALLRPQITQLLLDHADLGIAVEITEHDPVDDYEALVDALADVRRAGVRLVVDDAGAGYASLRHVLRLAPDAVKLDIALVADLHADPAKQAMVTAMVTYARATATQLVAEGVELPAEADALRRLGVGSAQGHLFGCPAPLL